MGRSTSRAALLVALAACLGGCVSGHLLDRARTREAVAGYRGVWLDDDQLVVAWDATITDDRGRTVGRATRVTAVPLAPLRRAEPPPVDSIPGRPLAAVPESPGRAVVIGDDATVRDEGVLVVRDPPAADAILYPGTLTRIRVAPWVWPLLPFTAAFDAVATPVLVALSPLVIVPGD
jgi:hypothetical protein